VFWNQPHPVLPSNYTCTKFSPFPLLKGSSKGLSHPPASESISFKLMLRRHTSIQTSAPSPALSLIRASFPPVA
jgi:hypothetical protein